MMTRRDDPSRAVALDLVLRTFMSTSEFNNMQPKNWDAIAKLIPGTMAQECAKRFEELQCAAGDLSHVGNYTSLAAHGKPVPRGNNAETALRRAQKGGGVLRPSSSCPHDGNKGKKLTSHQEDLTPRVNPDATDINASSQLSSQKEPSASQKGNSGGPNIVIHVCDEAKNVKRDFTCPRDLLVREMKYFAEYLSLDTQRWEEVDISVHCDVQIFEWLMRYVHRHVPEMAVSVPKLGASNVISILISSDFLKMDALVTECVDFCHKHMSAIVSTPCNMNCINDKLVARIASLFTDVEADEVRDKKDKFKSKLFIKKIEQLFDPSSPSATLHKCQHCKRLLTKGSRRKLKCLPTRLSIDRTGRLMYHHQRMAGWDINESLTSLHSEVKSWRDVYWRLWGQINTLKCSRCRQVFQCSELSQCWLHPKNPVFVNSEAGALKSSVVGSYPCCDQPAYRFDPLQQSSGCEIKDHLVTFSGLDKSDPSSHESRILDTLLERRDVICSAASQTITEKWSDANVFGADEVLSGVVEEGLEVKGQLHNIFPDDTLPFAKHIEVHPEPVASSTDDWDTSDDEVGDDEEPTRGRGKKGPMRRKPSSKTSAGREKQVSAKARHSPVIQRHRKKWDASRSLRFNQDIQREEDQLRGNFLAQHLMKMRVSVAGEKQDRSKVKEYAGGMFSKVDAQFKASIQVSKPVSLQPLSRTKSRNIQNKMP